METRVPLRMLLAREREPDPPRLWQNQAGLLLSWCCGCARMPGGGENGATLRYVDVGGEKTRMVRQGRQLCVPEGTGFGHHSRSREVDMVVYIAAACRGMNR